MRAASAGMLLVTAIMALWSVSVHAAMPGKVKVTVLDSEGAALGKAYLLFHFDSSGTVDSHPDRIGAADDHGRFEVELAPGFYDVCVMVPSFVAQCRKLLVEQGKTIQHDVTLAVDEFVWKHIGERFP